MRTRFLTSCLIVAGLFFGCSSKDRTKTEKLQVSAFSEISVPAFSVDPSVFQRIPFDAIHGTRPEEIKSWIRLFPFSDYQMVGVYSGFEVEYFCVDSFVDYIKKQLRTGQPWESHLSPYIYKYCRPGSVAIDIGAHVGTHTIQLSRSVGRNGKVFAIEPQPKIFRELVVNMALNQADNIDYFWGAAGSQHSTIELSPLNIDNEGATGLGVGRTGQFVDMIPLDSLHLQNVSFIKIDVEGMELDVLRGLRETILRDQPILLVEIIGGVRPGSATEETKKEIFSRIQFIEEMGYEVVNIDDTSDYLAMPKNSSALKELQNTKFYRHNTKRLNRLKSNLCH